jgi:hypothetical protein
MTHQVRELPASAWPGFVNRAEIATKKHTTIRRLTQDYLSVFRIQDRVFLDDLFGRHSQAPGQCFDVLAGNVHARLSAAVGARFAVDLFFHFVGDPAEQTFGRMVISEKPPKLKILSFLILRKVTDLNEVGNHGLSI